MKKITQSIKGAYAREAMVKQAKQKKPENLTIEEAREIVKWEKEKDRNNTIIGLTVGAISTGIWLSLLMDKQHEISEFEKYQKEHTK